MAPNTPSLKFHLIANTKSGKGSGATVPDIAKKIAAEVGGTVEHYSTENPGTFESQIEKAVAAAKKDGGTVIAAGGDGTIRSVAQKAAEAGATFAAVPCGTFNFFARAHNIPEECEAAFRIAMSGEVRKVRLGKLNDHYFLINASMGMYATSIKEREKSTSRFGRDRLVVIISSILSFFRYRQHFHVELQTAGKLTRVKTSSIFVGNNALQLRRLKMSVAQCMKLELLSAVVLKPLRMWERFRILWRGIAKTLENDERLETFCVSSLAIHLRHHRHIEVALDGEMFRVKSPIRITAEPECLAMRLPPKVAQV